MRRIKVKSLCLIKTSMEEPLLFPFQSDPDAREKFRTICGWLHQSSLQR